MSSPKVSLTAIECISSIVPKHAHHQHPSLYLFSPPSFSTHTCPPQLPEPLILFRYYNDFIGLAKESQSIIVEELEAQRLSPAPAGPPAQVSVELNRVLFKIKDLLRQLPSAHYKTLQFLMEHLHR